MTKEEKREIRQVLLGRTIMAEDGRITALEQGLHLSAGVSDGAGAVRFFGIASKSCCFDTSLDEQQTMNAAAKAMFEIGRGVILRTQPQAAACLIRYLIGKPVVLAFRYMDGVPILTIWSGRSIMGWISRRRAINVFVSELPEGVRPSLASVPKEAGNVIKEKKKRKKDKEKEKEEGEEK